MFPLLQQSCEHSNIIDGLCALCGISIDELPPKERAKLVASLAHSVVVKGSSAGTRDVDKFRMQVTNESLKSIRNKNTVDLIRKRRLALVLDLDKTLIHATHDPAFYDITQKPLEDEIAPHIQQIRDDLYYIDPKCEVVRPDGVTVTASAPHFVKVRFGARAFLERMASIFDLYVYTMGVRKYAESIVSILDPLGRTIKGRIVSRNDGGIEYKHLDTLLPVDPRMIVVLDDTLHVWKQQKNVLHLYPFNFFSEKPNRDKPAALKFIEHTATPVDNVLCMCCDVLTAVHAAFYRLPLRAYTDVRVLKIGDIGMESGGVCHNRIFMTTHVLHFIYDIHRARRSCGGAQATGIKRTDGLAARGRGREGMDQGTMICD